MIRSAVDKIVVKPIKFVLFKKNWRKKNTHNFTNAESFFYLDNVTVGKGTYGPINVQHYYRPAKLTIGNYCSIANKVEFLLGGNHSTKCISTYPFGPRVYNNFHRRGVPRKTDIVVEDDVWIGYGALILSGVTIGQGSIIGASSVVTKDVPPYSVYAGNRVIHKRFPEEIVEKLLEIDFSHINHVKGDGFEEVWDQEITIENYENVLGKFVGIKDNNG
ncbi:MAG: CatB-related O-acetyltransferase [Lachnospiraceae bacterium]|nr:CatB-related O-acetyltransferase [Lachnospiraceae bacterium]